MPEIVSQVISFVLGLVSSKSPTSAAVLLFTALLLYLLFIRMLPSVHPKALLMETQDQVTVARIWLDDEATTRRSVRMYRITANGHDNLRSVEQRVQTLLSQYEASLSIYNVFPYVTALPTLVTEARRCRSEIMTLRSDLKDEVRRLSDG